MPKPFEIFHINAFTKNQFEGNPAAVMFGDNLSEDQMQKIANQTNYSETAFLCKSEVADFRLRWFSPFSEVDLCGHASIAAVHFLKQLKQIKNVKNLRLETNSGILSCSVSGDEYNINMPVYEVLELTEGIEELISAYNIPVEIIDNNTPIFILSNSYVFIKIKSYNQLISYKPLINTEVEIHNKLSDVSMYTTETLEQLSSAHIRFFAPGFGINEDYVTGSACSFLAPVLLKAGLVSEPDVRKSIIIEQGDHLGRKGRVKVSYSSSERKLIMSGFAVTYLKGKINI